MVSLITVEQFFKPLHSEHLSQIRQLAEIGGVDNNLIKKEKAT
jgi:hypothetical protein